MIEEQSLWLEWQKEKTPLVADKLFFYYQEWVEEEAKRIFFSLNIKAVDLDDILQYAKIAVLESIRNFDVEKGINFRTFARLRIKGEIINRLEEYSEEQALLRTVLNVSKSKESIPEEADDLFEFVLKLVINHTKDVLYYDHFNDIYEREKKVEWDKEKENLSRVLTRGLSRLTDKERMVIEYSFFYSMSLVQVAELLDISKGRVSQLLKEGMAKLDVYFGNNHKNYEFF